MGTEVSTKSSLPSETSTPTSDDAKTAYDLRRRGRSFGYILDHTSYENAYEVAHAIKAYQIEMAGDSEIHRQEAIELEVARLDHLMAEMWDIMEQEQWTYNKDGDAIDRIFTDKINAAKVIISIIKQRAEILGLNEIDAIEGAAKVLVVQGQTADYVGTLKQIVQAG